MLKASESVHPTIELSVFLVLSMQTFLNPTKRLIYSNKWCKAKNVASSDLFTSYVKRLHITSSPGQPPDFLSNLEFLLRESWTSRISERKLKDAHATTSPFALEHQHRGRSMKARFQLLFMLFHRLLLSSDLYNKTHGIVTVLPFSRHSGTCDNLLLVYFWFNAWQMRIIPDVAYAPAAPGKHLVDPGCTWKTFY